MKVTSKLKLLCALLPDWFAEYFETIVTYIVPVIAYDQSVHLKLEST